MRGPLGLLRLFSLRNSSLDSSALSFVERLSSRFLSFLPSRLFGLRLRLRFLLPRRLLRSPRSLSLRPFGFGFSFVSSSEENRLEMNDATLEKSPLEASLVSVALAAGAGAAGAGAGGIAKPFNTGCSISFLGTTTSLMKSLCSGSLTILKLVSAKSSSMRIRVTS